MKKTIKHINDSPRFQLDIPDPVERFLKDMEVPMSLFRRGGEYVKMLRSLNALQRKAWAQALIARHTALSSVEDASQLMWDIEAEEPDWVTDLKDKRCHFLCAESLPISGRKT